MSAGVEQAGAGDPVEQQLLRSTLTSAGGAPIIVSYCGPSLPITEFLTVIFIIASSVRPSVRLSELLFSPLLTSVHTHAVMYICIPLLLIFLQQLHDRCDVSC